MKAIKYFASILLFNFQSLSAQNFWEPLTPIPNVIFASMAIDSAGYIYAGTVMSGLFISSDNGSTWSDSLALCTFIFEAFEFHTGEDIFMCDHGCTFHSSNHGLSWEFVYYTFNCHTILINRLEYLYIGMEQDYNVGRLARSTDGGLNWEYYDFPNLEVVYSMDFDSNNNLYAGTTSGIFISSDNGDSWGNNQLAGKWIPCLIITNNNSALVGTWGEGIFRSTDLGSNWIQTSLTTRQIRDFVLDQNGYLWTATNDGVFKSMDDGSNWLSVKSSGLTNLNIHAIAIDPEGFVVVGTDSGKVFRTVQSTTSVKQELIEIKFSLSQNYPNPFNPVTNIKYAVSSLQFVSLKVYDVLGNEIATIANEEKPACEYEVEFDGTGLQVEFIFIN